MRIMVLEDDPHTRHVLMSCLKSQYAVDAFATLSEAELPALTENYDLYIVDLMLPDGKGSLLALRIRQEKRKTPIVMLTAQYNMEERVRAFDSCGVDEYLTKPFSPIELLARVHRLMRQDTLPHSVPLTCGPLTFDERLYQIHCHNYLLALQKKDLQMLEYLMRHQERIVPKQEIIDHVWNMDACVSDNTFDAHIKAIRNQLRNAGCERLLHTRRGIGYFLSCAKNSG